MRTALLILSLFLAGSLCLAAEVTKLDDFTYPDAAAVGAAWVTMDETNPAELMPHGNKQALKIPCPFEKLPEIERGSFDKAVNLDLKTAGAISFDFYVDDPNVLSYCSIYFHSGNGWYGHSFGADKGWQRVVLPKGTFRIEDQPAGWDQIDTIRISAWKGKPVNTFCGFDNLEARTEDIALIRGMAQNGETRAIEDVANQVAGVMDKIGVPYGALTDQDVAGGALAAQKLAIFPYSPQLTPEAVAAILQYVNGGGKIIFFYSLPAQIAELLGATEVQYRARKYDGEFADVVFEQGLVGLPERMRQNSWNVTAFEAGGGHNAKVIADWTDAEGKAVGPGVLISDNGAFMGHVLTDPDPAQKQAFLMALMGHFVPGTWETAAQAALDKAQVVGPYADRAALDAHLSKVTPGASFAPKVKAALAEAQQAEADAKRLLAGKQYPETMAAAARVHESLMEAYLVAHRPRIAEFRAVWNHSGTGDCGTWDEAMKRLKDGGFNAVVPNMWWGGVAYYDSKLLPHAAVVEKQGDQIAQCVEAGKKYGMEVHPWKVNWNLSNAPKEFVDQMRAEGRLMVNSKGETENWLCASNPKNLQLEIDTMLEVARNYDVDGVHFDYIRYPHDDGCFCDGCRERFETKLGKKVENWPADCRKALREEWMQFRCDNITALVKATSEQAHKEKPWIKISAAVFSDYPGCKYGVGQDWVYWCKQGWIDFLCPMNYSDNDTRFKNLVTNQTNLIAETGVPLYAGIGQFIIPDDRVVGQMEMARELGADGFILFNMGRDLAEQGFPRYARSITSAPAIQPHNAPKVSFKTSYSASDQPVVVKAAELQMQVKLEGLGNHRPKATAATGKLELQDMEGRKLADLGTLPKLGQTVTIKIPRQQQMVRVAAIGTMTREGGAKTPFVTRSRAYSFGQ